MVITEKLDGTNASVWILKHGHTVGDDGVGIHGTYTPFMPDLEVARLETEEGIFMLLAGSRKRFVIPGKTTDNFGFAGWVGRNARELLTLGEGVHYGEWWGNGIQRGYGLDEKRFSLFNSGRWSDRRQYASVLEAAEYGEVAPLCCHVVPVLHTGIFDSVNATIELNRLGQDGSRAAPGFMNPEGIMIYHTAARQIFKKTFEGDTTGKENAK